MAEIHRIINKIPFFLDFVKLKTYRQEMVDEATGA